MVFKLKMQITEKSVGSPWKTKQACTWYIEEWTQVTISSYLWGGQWEWGFFTFYSRW